MHADDFRYDRYGVVSGLRDGGYSDDMTLAAIAGNHHLYEYLLFSRLIARIQSSTRFLLLSHKIFDWWLYYLSCQVTIKDLLHLLQLLYSLILLPVILVFLGWLCSPF